MGIGRFLTEKVIRLNKFRKLISHEVHGATYTRLKGTEVSNDNLTDVYTHKSDAYFRFLVVGRADCLPTPVNLQRWFSRGPIPGEEHCKRCHLHRRPTFAHLLNESPPNYKLMTERHNRVGRVVKEAVLKFVGRNLRSDIHQNTAIGQEGLSDGLKSLRPDMVFEREGRAGRAMEIREFSCPYGYVSHERDTLATVYEQKKAKYSDLANALRGLRQQPVNVTAIIVSSMGAVYSQSLKELRKILGCSNREMQKLGRRMSDAAITGSFKIWRKCAQRTERDAIGDGEEEGIIE
jgi:hypothetical protein